jgi:hypothetical protein
VSRRPSISWHGAWLLVLPVPLVLVAFGLVTARLWALEAGQVAPRHRPEALCFLLERPPAFAPPFTVEPEAVLLRGRFALRTPALVAMQESMHLRDEDVLRHWAQHLGDYDVEVLWLRVNERGGDRHWLVVGWKEDKDLALCSFRFPGSGPELNGEEVRWGDLLLDRILTPQNFRSGCLPAVRLRPSPHGMLPAFGPLASR